MDECVSLQARSKFMERKSGFEIQLISKLAPGYTDDRIILELLNHDTCLLTSDRIFHNKVLSLGLESVYCEDGNHFLSSIIPGFRPRPGLVLSKNSPYPLELFHGGILRTKLLPASDTKLKKLRTKIRRIKNYFQGFENIDSVAVSLSILTSGDSIIVGTKWRIISDCDIKALNASEQYIIDELQERDHSYLALCYLLIYGIQLRLNKLSTNIYYDKNLLNLEETGSRHSIETKRLVDLMSNLKNEYDWIQFIPVSDNTRISGLNSKLRSLYEVENNELIEGDLNAIADSVLGCTHLPSKTFTS